MTVRGACSPVEVLVVEDDVATRQGLGLLLAQWGYPCLMAADGHAAIELARVHSPRLVLLDLLLPHLSGFAVARALRADPHTRATRIFAISSLSDDRARQESLEAGCERHFHKPVDLEMLREAVAGTGVGDGSGLRSGLSLGQAETLLDWLENQGCTGLRLTLEGSGFCVHWVAPSQPAPHQRR